MTVLANRIAGNFVRTVFPLKYISSTNSSVASVSEQTSPVYWNTQEDRGNISTYIMKLISTGQDCGGNWTGDKLTQDECYVN